MKMSISCEMRVCSRASIYCLYRKTKQTVTIKWSTVENIKLYCLGITINLHVRAHSHIMPMPWMEEVTGEGEKNGVG